jgi:N-methylhydantoinase A
MSDDRIPESLDRFRIAIDVGGTFTDLVATGGIHGRRTYKTSSTPQDPPSALLNGLALIAVDNGLALAQLLDKTDAIVHGTTITTNALLTRTGAVTGLMTTSGFRDVLPMRQGRREDQMNSKSKATPSLVPRHLIKGVRGRVDREGVIVEPLARDEVIEACRFFESKKVESIAISFMFSYLNADLERAAAAIVRHELPSVFVSLSSEVAPEVRLYERTSTATLNAYVGPILQSYLANLERRLRTAGYGGVVLIMQSNGGVALIETAGELPVNTLLSGPAGGPVATATIATALALPKALTIDMGGTSFEASVARNGITESRSEGKIGGYAITTQMLDISTIGAGGGSIAWFNPGGELRVGPQSAGALPGPACYGRGGTEATVTDASLLLGYLNPLTFGNGQLTLDQVAAERAVGMIAARLAVPLAQAAAGIYATINASMTDSLRLATINKGHNPREFALIAAGGAGPIHAAELARDLDIALVVVPRDASVLCAAGMLTTDFIHYSVVSLVGRRDEPGADEIERIYGRMEDDARHLLVKERVAPQGVEFRRFAQVRYQGQLHFLDVDFVSRPITAEARSALHQEFIERHLERYGHSLPNTPTELVNLRLCAIGRIVSSEATCNRATETSANASPKRRQAWFDGRYIEVPVWEGNVLADGALVRGPALIELPMSTIVVPGDFEVSVGPQNYLMYAHERSLVDVLAELRTAGAAS